MSNRSIQLKDEDGSLFPISRASLIIDDSTGKTQTEINADLYTKLTGATPGNTLTYHGRKVSLVTPGDYTVGIKSLLSTNYGSHFTEQTWNGGLAISDGIAVLTFNYGFLVMLNWADKSLLGTGKAACYSTTNHAGNCSFGTTHYAGNKIPLLYISECDETHNKSYRCFVENVVQNGSDLTCSNVQTITYNGTKLNSTYTTDWAVDPIEGYLYGYGYKPGETQNSARNTIVMMRFRIPEIMSKTVALTDSDVLATKEVVIDGILQGCSVSGGVFLYPYSNNDNGGVTGNGMVIYDFNNDLLLFKTSLWEYTKKELEGGCLYDGKAYVVGHTYGQNNADAEYIEVSFLLKDNTGEQRLKSNVGSSLNITTITWDKLKALRDSGGLQTGLQYCITDYQCTTSLTDTKSAGHQFDIIVTALSPSVLSEKTSAVLHNGDTYFTNSKLLSWLLWYCLDNDTTRFAWADTTNGKGVIYRMIDEFGNDCPYDFKNIQFKRYNITGVKNSKSLYVGIGTYLGIKSDLLTINSDSYIWTYTFCGIPLQSSEDASKYEDGDTPKLDTSNVVDLSLNLYSSYYRYTDFYNCYNNKISTTKKVSYEEKLTVNIPITLPDIVFLSLTIVFESRDKNYFVMYGFHDNVLEGHCEHISIGDKSCYNIFKGFTEYCVFVESFLNNIFTGTLNNNIFANIIEYNSFSGVIENNIFNVLMRYNKFIGHCYNNNFTNLILNCIINDLGYNTFNNSILYSTFTDVTSCTFKSSIYHCLFLGDCYGCIFPEDSNKSLLYIRLCGKIYGSGLATITVTLDSKKELIITLDSITDDPFAP